MLDKILDKIKPEADLPERAWMLDVRRRALDGTLYDVLPHAFEDEEDAVGKYIKVADRRPSVRCGLVRTVVEDSVSLLFSDGHFPGLRCDNEDAQAALEMIGKDTHLRDLMLTAATRGSVGSIAIYIRFLSSRIFLDVIETDRLTPAWKRSAPDMLEKVTELRKVSGKQLREVGYNIDDAKLSAQHWYMREWTDQDDCWYVPIEITTDSGLPKLRDEARSQAHGLGFVPIVWIKNLPSCDAIDGAPTFSMDALSTAIEIDYQLSQAGRGLRYSSDPTLLIKEPAGTGEPAGENKLVRSASNALVVDAKGDAKMLEIDGSACAAVLEYCRELRAMALESMHGNRAHSDKMTAAQSGRAMELMNQALIWLADKLRSSYGERGLLGIYRMICLGAQKFPLVYDGQQLNLPTAPKLSLIWPDWFPPTAQDKLMMAQAVQSHIESGTISAATAIANISSVYDIESVDDEQSQIDAERKAKLAELPQAQSKVTLTE